ncbi:MAG TPA: copper homeostasis protein CutC, partial [Gemmataceae bacterium]|nr:copper homeostasis protein CutC [Gemmataceae bacterium]
REDGTVDERRCGALRRQMGEVPAVFHRAFDVTARPLEALEQLIALGFRRVLTSGQQTTALQGAALITELVHLAAGRIEILPGGGVNRLTARDLITQTGCNQVHGSLRCTRTDSSTMARPNVFFGASRQREDQYDTTDQSAVAQLCELFQEIADGHNEIGSS